MYNYGILCFMIFMATFAPCNGNMWHTKGLYAIVILVLLTFNVNDIIEVIIKEDDKPRDGLMGDLVKYEPVAGLVSTLLLLYAAYNRECGIYYILIIILAPIVLVLILYGLDYYKGFLGFLGFLGFPGLSEFSFMDYLPNGVKRLNDIINILTTKNENNSGPDRDISNTGLSVDRKTSSDSRVSYSESNSPDSTSGSYDNVRYESSPSPGPSPGPSPSPSPSPSP